MRKIAVILLGLMLGWLCGVDAKASPVEGLPRSVDVQACIDSSSLDELRCERVYNSDLGLPQPVVVEPVRIFTVRTMPCPERLGVRCGVASGRHGERVDRLPGFTVHLFFSGADAVDYYVYRLRRLLI